MNLTSSAFKDGGEIPKEYTADGENINPELIVSNIPKAAKSLVLVVEDPDAKPVCGFTWIHWIVFDIPVNGDEVVIKEDSVPGVFGENSYKKQKYGGPSPPTGTGIHNYYFKVFALDDKLGLPEMSSLEEIEKLMEDHILDRSEIVGLYSRD